MKPLAGKVAWVTGAGTGIGRAAALMFAREGARVAILGRRLDKLDAVAGEIRAAGGEAETAALDVSDRAAVDRVASALLARHGRVDILANNAGINIKARRIDDLSAADWDQVVGINLTGAYNMFKAAFATMRAQGDGLVINIASTAARRASGIAGMAYTASKFGMLGMSLSLTQEAWKFGIRTCCICPDDVNTPIMEKRAVKYSEDALAAMIQPDDLAEIMRLVALMPKRTSIPEIVVAPSAVRAPAPVELGLPG